MAHLVENPPNFLAYGIVKDGLRGAADATATRPRHSQHRLLRYLLGAHHAHCVTTGGIMPTDTSVVFWANAFLGGTVGQSLNSGVVYRNVGGIGVSQQLMSDVTEPSTYAMFLTGGVLAGLQQRLKRK